MSLVNSVPSEPYGLFKILNGEVTWLHTVWELYIQFYGTSDENYELMNEVAPQFFAILKIMLFDELAMILNRLTEKAITLGKANASLEQLIEQIDPERDSELARSLRAKLEKIRADYGAFRTWRDKKLSHNDLQVALQRESSTLPGITRQQAEDAIREVAEFMNEYSLHILNGQQAYRPFMIAHGDGTALMQFLKRATESRNNET
jgi:hypothetical protein